MAGECYGEAIQLSDQDGLGNGQRIQLWGSGLPICTRTAKGRQPVGETE